MACSGKPRYWVGSGCVPGLVAITPGPPDFCGTNSSNLTDRRRWLLRFATSTSKKRGYDYSLDASAATGSAEPGVRQLRSFRNEEINPAGATACLRQSGSGMVAAHCGRSRPWLLAFVGSVILLRLFDFLVGLRATEGDDRHGS